MKLKAISRKLGTAALILSVFLVLINMLTGCAQERGTGISPAETIQKPSLQIRIKIRK